MAKGTAVVATPRTAAVAVQRRQNDHDLRERLVRVEAATDEIPRVRDRLTALGESMQTLVAQNDEDERRQIEAADYRRDIKCELEKLSDSMRTAATVATRATELATGHIIQCEKDKTAASNAQASQHKALSDRLAKVEIRVWMAMGGIGIIGFLGELLMKAIIK